MNSKHGLWVALVGLFIVVLWAIPFEDIADAGTRQFGGATDGIDMSLFVGHMGGLLGLAIMIVGLAIAAVPSLTK